MDALDIGKYGAPHSTISVQDEDSDSDSVPALTDDLVVDNEMFTETDHNAVVNTSVQDAST